MSEKEESADTQAQCCHLHPAGLVNTKAGVRPRVPPPIFVPRPLFEEKAPKYVHLEEKKKTKSIYLISIPLTPPEKKGREAMTCFYHFFF